jgi:phospholipase A1
VTAARIAVVCSPLVKPLAYAALLVSSACVLPASDPEDTRTRLEQRWQLGDSESRSRSLAPVAHGQNYLLPVRWSSEPNQDLEDSTSATLGQTPSTLDEVEIKFQISFKARLLDDLPLDSSLWAAYTQQSNWQAYEDSSPFRSTDHAPEVIWNVPIDRSALGWNLRFVNFAYAHQSNGQDEPLSRSWDRLYAQVAFEREHFAVFVRPWLIIGDDSDNPDIDDFLGDGDVVAVWMNAGHVVSLLVRNNLDFGDNHGGIQADWSWGPLDGPRMYVQVFSGYGETLLDYDHAQTTVGVGVILTDRL